MILRPVGSLYISLLNWIYPYFMRVITQIYLVIESIKQRKQNLDTTGDPWNGRTLEWATHSPPPFYNFAVVPPITSHEVFWDMKKQGGSQKKNMKISNVLKIPGWEFIYPVLLS